MPRAIVLNPNTLAQQNWKLTCVTGRQYVVGMFHGHQSGHLMVHCNSSVILIDFNVLKSKNYSFYIEDELCQFSIDRQGSVFSYDFKVDAEADTPRNRRRREAEREERAERRQMVWLGVGTVIFLIALISVISLFTPSY